MRIYLIASNRGIRLVRANHRAQALSYVASQEDLVKYLAEGNTVETATPPNQGSLDL